MQHIFARYCIDPFYSSRWFRLHHFLSLFHIPLRLKLSDNLKIVAPHHDPTFLEFTYIVQDLYRVPFFDLIIIQRVQVFKLYTDSTYFLESSYKFG